MYEFCTYFDHRYLGRAIALVGSLRRACTEFRLWALCLDDEALLALGKLALPEVRPVRLAELEQANPDLVQVRPGRSALEYYFTCSPFLPSFILDRHPETGTITYLDADLFFFADPAPLFREMGDAPVAIIGHRFPARLAALEAHGVFNVGWLSFRRDARAFECLAWWQQRCLEWCYDRVDAGRFADQKYLDDWPTRFPGTVVLQHRGAGIAPWNLESHRIAFAGGHPTVDGQAVIFVHFHGVKRVAPCVYDLGFAPYGSRASGTVVRRVFAPYLGALLRADRQIRAVGFRPPPPHGRGIGAAGGVGGARPSWFQRLYRTTTDVLRRRYALRVLGFTP